MTFTNRYQWSERLRGCMDHLTPTEYIVLTMLASYTNSKTGTAGRPAAATLAADSGVSVKTVRRSLASLVDKGYLVVARQGGGKGKTTSYDLVWDMPHLNGIPGHQDDHVSDDEYVDTQDDHVTDTANVDTISDHVTVESNVVNVDTQDDHVANPIRGHLQPHTWSNPTPYVDIQGDHRSIDPTTRSNSSCVSSNSHQSARATTRPTPTQKLAEIRSTFETATAGLPAVFEEHPQPRHSMIEIPDDWKPNDLHRARFPRPDLDDLAEAFRDHAISVGRTCKGRAGWDAAFNTWVRKSQPATPPGVTKPSKLRAIAELAAAERNAETTRRNQQEIAR